MIGRLIMLSEPTAEHAAMCHPHWSNIVAKIFTALTGYLCLVVEDEGKFYAQVTDIPVTVPPRVRETAEMAAGLTTL